MCNFTRGGKEVSKGLRKLIVVMVLCVVLTAGVFAQIQLRFFYPVQVAGPLSLLIDEMVAEFNTQHPDIKVEPIYSGNYDQTLARALTAARGGNPPEVVVLLAIDLFTLLDLDLIEDVDQFMTGEYEDFTASFYDGFLENSILDGVTWGIPFQRSTPIFYYNKDHFREVGLDPDKPPTTWDELLEAARLLTIRDSRGNVTRWGFADITSDTWTIQALILQAGGEYANEAGTEAYFNTPPVKEALEFWNRLANIERLMPRHRAYGAASQDFVAGALSMMFNSTGSLSFVRTSATFDFGVAPLPCNELCAVPTGGGNLYILKGLPEANKQAAWKFITWMTNPENAAKWSIGTGYIPVREDAFETASLKQYAEDFPAILVARDQLAVARREMAFHNNSQIREVLLGYVQDMLDERLSIDNGLRQLQNEVDMILAPFK